MADKLVLSSIGFDAEGRVLLGLKLDSPISLDQAKALPDVDGDAQHEVIIRRGEDAFTVRTVSQEGEVVKVIASTGPIPDDWARNPEEEPRREHPLQ